VAAPRKTRFREKRRTAVAWSASAAIQAALEFFSYLTVTVRRFPVTPFLPLIPALTISIGSGLLCWYDYK
jgi:hypothetical protein